MTWVQRTLLYLPILFLICVVYAGQRCTNARDTIALAVRLTVKSFVYTVVLVVVMWLCAVLFIG